MQQQLDAANAELMELKSGSSSLSSTGVGAALPSSSGPTRVRGLKQSAERADKNNGAFYGGFIDRSDIEDKRVEQLSREKRELIAKNLEENKDKMELSQKLILSEKEVASLKSKVTKLTLEKERIERKMTLSLESSARLSANIENTPNFSFGDAL